MNVASATTLAGALQGFGLRARLRNLRYDLGLEFRRLRKRAVFWWLLVLTQLLMVSVSFGSAYHVLEFFYGHPDALIPPHYVPLEWLGSRNVYNHVCAALLAVIVFGPDYSSGCYRLLYSRGASRLRVPLAKTMLVFGMASVNWVVWSLLSVALGTHLWNRTQDSGRVLIEAGADLTTGADVYWMLVRSLVALAVYCLFASAAVSLFKGTAAGVGMVCVILFLEYLGFPLFSLFMTEIYEFDLSVYYTWSITEGLAKFVQFTPTGFWDRLGLLTMLAGYAAFFCVAMWFSFARRDVPGRP